MNECYEWIRWMIDQIVRTVKAVIIAANAKCSTLMKKLMNAMNKCNKLMRWMNEMNELDEWMRWMNFMNEWDELIRWMN
jgi:hypothetical protein